MILPEGGNVVIIDDQPNEVMPIIQALSKKGISTTYYQGNDPNLLPNTPCQFIRLVFLDLQLIETSNEHQITKNIINILEKIISPNNGPYILVIWSKNSSKYESAVGVEIKKHDYLSPSCILSFNKRDCLEEKVSQLINSDDVIKNVLGKLEGRLEEEDELLIKKSISDVLSEEYKTEFIVKDNAIEIIEKHIKEGLEEAGIFHLFVIWENLIRKAGAHTVEAISSTIEKNDLWEINMRDVIKRMARARTGQNVITNGIALESALTTFTNSFSEELESEIRLYEFPEYIDTTSSFLIADNSTGNILKISEFEDNGPKVKLSKDDIDVKGKEKMSFYSMGKLSNGLKEPDKTIVEKLTSTYIKIPDLINTKLHIELNPNDELIPGNVYKIDVANDIKQQYLLTYFDNIKGELDNYTFIELEVSPICDYAQTKWKKSRLISGIIYCEDNKAKKNDHLYTVQPTILIDNITYRLIFDFHLFKSLDNKLVNERNVYLRLKRELLLDIIANLSGHVNRPGISFMT